jgi:isopentenyl-diphosphate delta-isomerase
VDHVLLVKKDVELHVNPNEVEAIEYVSKDQLAFLLLNDQNRHFSPWFHLIGANLLPKWWNSLEFFLEKDQQDQTIHDYR